MTNHDTNLDHQGTEHDNAVSLRGRLSRAPELRDLPSGDRLVLLQLAVTRPDGSRADGLPVAVGPAPGRGRRREPGQASAATVRAAGRLAEGDRIRVEGWLQRRFWNGPAGRRTRLEVVAESVMRT